MGVFKDLDVALGATSDEEGRLRLAVDAATSLVEHCCHAGFTVNDDGHLTTRAGTDEVVRRANDLQQELALSLYAACGVRFEPDDVAIAQTLAAHLAMVVAAGRESDQLGQAVHNRTIIGQAQGILIERLDVDAAQAFDYLRRVSSTSNRKLAEVAAEIARTRHLPDATAHQG